MRILNYEFLTCRQDRSKFSITGVKGSGVLSKSMLLVVFSFSFLIASCSKKPAELYDGGMKSFAAKDYAKAQEYFADGIKKEGNMQLYAGFIAANLVTGKYPQVNDAYNKLTEAIRSSLIQRYGKRLIVTLGITTELPPYNVNGGNQIPPDFPGIVMLQAKADYEDFITVEQQIDRIVKE